MSSIYVAGGALGVVTVTAGGRVNMRRLQNLERDLPKRAESAARTHAHLVAYWARAFAPVQEVNSQGFLQNDRHLTIAAGIQVQQLSTTRYAIVATAPQSAPQEFGSDAHLISARNGGSLKFWWERESRWTQPAVVRHPGNPPHPFMLPARRKVSATWFRAVRNLFEESSTPLRVNV